MEINLETYCNASENMKKKVNHLIYLLDNCPMTELTEEYRLRFWRVFQSDLLEMMNDVTNLLQ